MGLFSKKTPSITIVGESTRYVQIVKGELEAIMPGKIKEIERVSTNRKDIVSVRILSTSGKEKFITFPIEKDDIKTVLGMGATCNAVKDLLEG